MGIVAKFGGSSVRDSIAMNRCARIVEQFPETQIVVISATYNTTNQLEALAEAAKQGDKTQASALLGELEAKHQAIANDLNIDGEALYFMKEVFIEAKSLMDKFLSEKAYSDQSMDQLYSVGERLSSCLFSQTLAQTLPGKKVEYLDARKLIITNDHYGAALPQLEKIQEECLKNLGPLLETPEVIIVTQGFIGATINGETTTLGREGSDFSATLLGEAIDASCVQIWTDVPGIFTADPKLDKAAILIPEISYDEATKMAEEGAKILFPKTLLPAKRKGIQVFIGSSLEPDKGGSLVGKKNV